MDLSSLKRHHEEILSLVGTIKKLLNQDELYSKALDASLKLGELSGKITVHLTAEDKFLYPKLMGTPNKLIQTTAQRFVDEMGNLAKVFGDYKSKYLAPSNIKADPKGFIQESEVVFAALQKRIDLEKKELYPLLS
ncbi:MAG: hemerythrin domain-containing protein [Peptococcaceae bacterium]|nr:hemerythrin domain-containing protein [Peptococcaceae bacterium]